MSSSLIFLFVGLIYAALGIPLILKKVKRNRIYGFRNAKTLSDDRYWFSANSTAGMYIILSGVAIIVADAALLASGSDEMSTFWALLVLTVISTIASVALSYRHLNAVH